MPRLDGCGRAPICAQARAGISNSDQHGRPCTDEYHPLAKIAKDMAAGAVLIASAAALGVGIAVFLPRPLRPPG